MQEYIGEEAICATCGNFLLIVALDEDDLPLCGDCATKDMPARNPEHILRVSESRPTKRAADLLNCPQCEGELHNGYCSHCKAAFEIASR